jgi:hypothetical protein
MFWQRQIELRHESSLSASYCDIQGGRDGIYVPPDSTLNWGPGNIDNDPLVTADGHLQINSPCINLGDPNRDYRGQRDVDGETRVAGGRIDIGADEYIDTDYDGLPDWWEKRYFGDANAADPEADADSDGYTNLEEYKISSNPVRLKIYYVDCNRPDDSGDGLSWETAKQTIQAAINAAYDTDRVIIAEGVYTGKGNRDMDFYGKMIIVRSKDPGDPNTVAATIIDCNGSASQPHRGFKFRSLEGPNSILTGLTITNGYAGHGGGILCHWSSPTIEACNITGNTAKHTGGAIDCNACNPNIVACDISANYSGKAGGAICCCNYGSPTISDCSISGNMATEFGGAVYCPNSTPIIENCAVADNKSGQYGGGICGLSPGDSRPQITNCTISGNSAPWCGGAAGLHDGNISNSVISGNVSNGAALYYCGGSVTNCTIVGNTYRVSHKGQVSFTNCIMWDNRPPFFRCLHYCCVMGASGSDDCIGSDPCFVVPGYWDPNGTYADPSDDFWVEGDYHLKSEGWRWNTDANQWDWDEVTSRCIDAGNPGSPLGDEPITLDIDPLKRCGQNLRINMGAYGGTFEASMPPYDWALLADLTNDGTVDFDDLMYWTQDWPATGSELPADLDRNGRVDGFDFALFALDWLLETSWRQP